VTDDSADLALVRLVDQLEDTAGSYLSLEDVERAFGSSVARSVAEGLLVVDHRTRLDGTPVTLCRLNRHHPLVRKLTSW
jgi:transcriptional regulator GlxA family with amidase domain